MAIVFAISACTPATDAESVERFDAPYDGPPETIALLIDARGQLASTTQETMADAALFALLDHPYAFKRFDVIERSRVDAILAEFDLARGGLVEASTAARVGELLGAQSIVLMSLSGVSVSPYALGVSGFGLAVYDVRASVSMRMVDVATGRIVAAVQQRVQQVVPGAFVAAGIAFGGSPEDAALLTAVTDGASRAIDDLMRTVATR